MTHPKSFDPPVKKEILEELMRCDAYRTWNCLDSVAIKLTHECPIESVFAWLADYPPDFELKLFELKRKGRSLHLDDRSTAIEFLRRLLSMDLQDAPRRHPNGQKNPDSEAIAEKLSRLPSFDIAINTWLEICKELLAICNVDYIGEVLQKNQELCSKCKYR